jgi:dTDP-4-amino-4,6-dideoxygalactose transaminase
MELGVKMMNIPITKTIFGQEEAEAIVKPLETGWVVQGPNVAKFQEMFSEFTHARYSHATTSCTTALHLGLEAMGITRGDKVIVPSFTYVASANAVEYTGAEVVFCDINLRTFNMDEKKLEELIQNDSSIKAIMPVHLFGLCSDMPFIMELAKRYNLKVIEDSACGFDGWIGEKHSGTFGDVGCFSFHPRKSICTGEGGMLITNDDTLANIVSQLKDHGASKSDLQRHKEKGGSLLPDFTMRGYNYRMTDMQGALGVCQMNKKEYIMNGRRDVASKYDTALKDIPELITPYIPENYKHGFQSYVCIFSNGEDISHLTKEQIDRVNIKRNIFMEKLEDKNIATRQGTHAVHTLGYYKDKNGFNDEDFLMSYAGDRLSIAIPLYAGMSDEEFDYVVSSMKEALE